MKVKTYAIVALAALITISASAAIAREYFENEPVQAPVTKHAPKAVAVKEEKICDAKYKYPVSPQDKKRAEAIFYWNPEAAHHSRFNSRELGEPRYKGDVAGSAFREVVVISDYPCNRCVLNTKGQYEYRTNRSN